ncbi:MAG: acyl-CoA thioesterase [Rhodospirillales bacterium]|nr:acyl-CoA thioesterase [Rhodospirillales bacterium]
MSAGSDDQALPRRADYAHFVPVQTRWSDNDQMGHINNVEYYRFFEFVVIHFTHNVLKCTMLDGLSPYSAETLCRFRKPLSFPGTIDAALRVEHVGRTSVRYGLALFAEGDDEAAAHGHWVHVFVGRDNEKPRELPTPMRQAMLDTMAKTRKA